MWEWHRGGGGGGTLLRANRIAWRGWGSLVGGGNGASGHRCMVRKWGRSVKWSGGVEKYQWGKRVPPLAANEWLGFYPPRRCPPWGVVVGNWQGLYRHPGLAHHRPAPLTRALFASPLGLIPGPPWCPPGGGARRGEPAHTACQATSAGSGLQGNLLWHAQRSRPLLLLH